MPEIKSVWVQTAAPRLPEFPGAVEQGFYFVTDGLLTMCTENGKPIGKPYRLQEGDKPHRIAGRLRLQAWQQERGNSDFNRPLRYRPLGIV
ncbi:hypothetical protein V1292_005135 [Bradyrhizobium sp. AZCC 1719]|uniref:hypothetical protein n=1 Tax=Bradyrhizobium sp. AZCC 1719 TaxID=3117028 RepID=UPI002FF3FBDF